MKEKIKRTTVKKINSMRTNFWRNTKDKEAFAKVAFIIEYVAKTSGFTKCGIMCTLISAGISRCERKFPEISEAKKLWPQSDAYKSFHPNKNTEE